MKKLMAPAVAMALLAVLVPGAGATIYTLTDLNSVFRIDDGPALQPLQWDVDGVSQLYQQGFWFGLGSSAEERLGNYFTSASVFGTNIAVLDYTHTNFTARVTYVLTGGSMGSGMSDMAETIRLTNTSTTSLSMHFFQYADFDLGGTSSDDLLEFSNANAVRQRDTGGSSMLSETVVTPIPDHHEGDIFPTTINELDDAFQTTLSDLPAIGGGSLFGDVTWAFQWDQVLGAGQTLIISKDKLLSPVPEPGTLMLLGMGLLGAGAAGFRRRKSK